VSTSRRRTGWLPLLGYTAISCGYFGWPLLPHPGRALIGSTQDPQLFVWAFAWWPHAIANLTNPFITHAAYVPTGVNLAWTVSVPTLALVFSPLTVLFGPVVSYNVAALLMPALAASTAYLLCRQLTRSTWASLVGGYLYGFSGSVLREEAWGNLHVTAIFLLPLFALAVVRFVQGGLNGIGLAWRIGVLVALQLGISTEFALTVTLMLAIGVALALWLVAGRRQRIRSSLRPIATGYVLAGVLSGPLLAFVALGFVASSIVPLAGTNTDLLNLIVPTQAIAIGGSAFRHVSTKLPDGGIGVYLGLPTLAIVAWYGIATWRNRWTSFLLAGLGVATLFALGSALQVDGRRILPLPWAVAQHLPALRNALPFRFGAYVSLAAAAIVALWIATRPARAFSRRYLLPALAIAAVVPAAWQARYHERPPQFAFFTDKLYRACIPRNETVTIFPFGGGYVSLLWQAQTDFWFRMAEDGLQPYPVRGKPLNTFDADPIVRAFVESEVAQPTTATLLAFAARHHVDRFISVPAYGYPSAAQMRSLGSSELIGGLLVAPACGQPSLTRRDLRPYLMQYSHNSNSNIGYCTGANFIALPATLDPAGPIAGAKHANFVAGQGLTCAPPPAGYARHGFATPAMGEPGNTYPYYAP